jgi:ketosteroid isomerase-like protein
MPGCGVPNPEQLVRGLYERYQARDWRAARELLQPDARLEMPATAEVYTGRDDVLGLQERYPEPWGELTVLRVVSDGEHTAVAEFEIVAPVAVFRCAAFWETRNGLLARGVEYWVTVGEDEPGPR